MTGRFNVVQVFTFYFQLTKVVLLSIYFSYSHWNFNPMILTYVCYSVSFELSINSTIQHNRQYV
jgi:hypothetical protein